MSLVEKFLGQLSEIPGVWMPFILAVVIGAAGIWAAMNWRYGAIIEKLRVERDYYKDLPARPQAALAQPASVAALLPPQRRLTEGEKSAITRHAISYSERSDAPKQITVGRNNASRSAIRCAVDLVEAFQKATWQVSEMGGSGFTIFPPTGIGLAFYNYGELAPDQRTVKEALELAGIPFDIIESENFMMARTTIFVTDPD